MDQDFQKLPKSYNQIWAALFKDFKAPSSTVIIFNDF